MFEKDVYFSVMNICSWSLCDKDFGQEMVRWLSTDLLKPSALLDPVLPNHFLCLPMHTAEESHRATFDHCIFPSMQQGERGPPGVNGTQGFQGCPGHRGTKVSTEGACMEQTQSSACGSSPRASPAALGFHATVTKST